MLIPAPWWVSYPEIVRFAGGEVVPLVTHAADGFRISPGDLDALITPRTRWLLLNSPGNPTGATYPAELLRGLAAVLRRHPQVLVMSDDIYAPLSYTGQPHATLAALCPDLADRVLTVSGVSKSHAMTGFRIGVAAGPQWLIAAMEKLQSHSSGNPCSISQAAAVAAFEGPQEFLHDWRERFRARRDLVVAAINAIPGLSTPVPDGAFYCMVDAAPLMDRFGQKNEQGRCAGDAPARPRRRGGPGFGVRRPRRLPHQLRRRRGEARRGLAADRRGRGVSGVIDLSRVSCSKTAKRW